MGSNSLAQFVQGRFVVVFYASIAVILNIVFLQALTAHAVSDYDNVVAPLGGEMKLHLPVNEWGMGRCSQPYLNDPKNDDLSTSWATYLLDPDYYTNQTVGAEGAAFWQSLLSPENVENYAWSAIQQTWSVDSGSPGYKTIFITASTTRGAEFVDIGGGIKGLRSTGNDTRSYYIDYYSYGNYNSETNPLGIRCGVHVGYWNNYGKAVIATEGMQVGFNTIFINYDIDYPVDYEGVDLSDSLIDSDDDGLSVAQELSIGTSDALDDTDSDGIDDYIESPWNSNRDDIFCDTSTPKNCAYPDPLKKDLYVEIDWMDDGSTSYKPTNTQLGMVVDMFHDQNVNLHFDTGTYGGGNALAAYTETLRSQSVSGVVDWYDYKNGGDGVSQNFATDRRLIWHYMISGNEYTHDGIQVGSSGWATVMGSDLFIAIGYIVGVSGKVSNDRAIANTIAHEIGHNLCLSSTRIYNEQPSGCVYKGIDNNDTVDDYYNLLNYKSVMNYRYQLTDDDDMGVVDYSEGDNGEGDHNDWSAVRAGMGKFNVSKTPYIEFGARGGGSHLLSPEGDVIISESK